MHPLSLTLTGFTGIRDGMARETLALDFAALATGAQLVALVGPNGRGKTTILDNMTPYPVMPSKAGPDGLGAFSYYDEVYLPVSRKELVWEMNGLHYLSQIVIRLNGKRRTEAYLHVDHGSGWQPAALPGGTVSDGRMASYLECVEAIAGPAATFFTTAFSAQNRRQLSHYRNAEIKALLGDLLGLERVRAKGAQAAETARLLRHRLGEWQHERALLQQQMDAGSAALERLRASASQTVSLEQRRQTVLAAIDERKNML